MKDPYFYLSDIADSLWDLYQNTSGKISDQAETMYNTLENIYLEPFRRSQVHQNTADYAILTEALQTSINSLDGDIKRINAIVDGVKKVAEYAAIFDQIIALAAKLAAV